MKIFKRVIWLLLIAFVLIQFNRIDKTNPPAVESEDFIVMEQPPQHIAMILKDTCYDCHSNKTKYPWYTNVAPVSWWIADHIEHGRHHLNFSTWAQYDESKKAKKIEEVIEEVEEGEMPLASYLPLHPEARLSDNQINELVNYFKTK